MLALQVIEGYYRVRIATVQKKGIRCGGRFFLPVSMECIDGGASGPSGSLVGATLGAITFGVAGAVVGSMAARRGRTAVNIKTTDGSDMVCTVASDEFPALYVEVQRLIALAATGYVPPEPAKVKAEHVLPGPFYFLRFGPGWFIAAISITILTFGFGWLLALPRHHISTVGKSGNHPSSLLPKKPSPHLAASSPGLKATFSHRRKAPRRPHEVSARSR